MNRIRALLLFLGSFWLVLEVVGAGEVGRFVFREPRRAAYRVEVAQPAAGRVALLSAGATSGGTWVKAWPENGSTNGVEFSNRVVLELKEPGDPAAVIGGRALRVARRISDRLYILEGVETLPALRAAEELADHPSVASCYPVARRKARPHGAYARRPNDPYFFQSDMNNSEWQPYLEHRDTNGLPAGPDLNIRAAWAISRGLGTTIAICDDGFEMDHPDLKRQVVGAPHFNFHTGTTNAGPNGPFAYHATAVAGLAGAAADNRIGMAGVAPGARLANWILFDSTDSLPDSEQMMDMFQYRSNVVTVQNHSWGKVGEDQLWVPPIERMAVSNAVTFGREGRGILIVRSAGNGRSESNNANDDGYLADPGVIAVGAARLDGRVARYSNPGACVLVAGFSGDTSDEANPCVTDSPNLFTTDRQGSVGYSRLPASDDLSNYAFGNNGFSGTSAAAPQISGLAALIVGANPALGYRDVQQILALSSRHVDLEDPDLRENGAGLRVSHNLGYGLPDAGQATTLARQWIPRPAAETLTWTEKMASVIPDMGLTVAVEGAEVPPGLRAIPALAGTGIHADEGTPTLPVTDIGLANSALTADLTGRAALIKRGSNFFCEKLDRAAAAGAAFAVVFNNRDGNRRIVMGGTDFSPIPAVMISENDGEALQAYLLQQPAARMRIQREGYAHRFQVADTLVCEQVGLMVETDHSRRGDLRIALVSPAGTRSILQHANADDLPGPDGWTYYSVQHFYESSAGTWTVEITDEDEHGSGRVLGLNLIIRGIRITDSDRDGLDDGWEQKHFATLAYGPKDDPDGDGWNNAREQVLGTHPNKAPIGFKIDLSVWDENLVRLSWESNRGITYEVRSGLQTVEPFLLRTNVPGRFPETEFFLPLSAGAQFFQVDSIPVRQ